jgi:hypothetical protein
MQPSLESVLLLRTEDVGHCFLQLYPLVVLKVHLSLPLIEEILLTLIETLEEAILDNPL